eukprot:6614523-Pyramimonas_sp.AAC.2
MRSYDGMQHCVSAPNVMMHPTLPTMLTRSRIHYVLPGRAKREPINTRARRLYNNNMESRSLGRLTGAERRSSPRN